MSDGICAEHILKEAIQKGLRMIGQGLCHDITQIIRGVSKGPVFRKGHVVQKEDIPVLLSVGKDTLFVWENDEQMMHEDEGAAVLRDLTMGAGMHASLSVLARLI